VEKEEAYLVEHSFHHFWHVAEVLKLHALFRSHILFLGGFGIIARGIA
jgi:hypothetical protein